MKNTGLENKREAKEMPKISVREVPPPPPPHHQKNTQQQCVSLQPGQYRTNGSGKDFFKKKKLMQ